MSEEARSPSVARRAGSRLARFRLLLGIVLSVAFLAVTVAGLDLALVGQIILAASPLGLVLALALVGLELSIRAYRWQALLGGIAPVPYRKAFGFLCIGYFANSMLPARLGDLARAYLAGNSFRIPRLATLGTVLVERVADGLTMVVAVIVASIFVPEAGAIRQTAIVLLLVGLAGLLVASLGLLAAHRLGLDTTRLGSLLRDLLLRVLAGTRALRHPRGLAIVLATTFAGFVTAVSVLWTVGMAVGLELSAGQAALVSAGLALSLAIPAAPGSLGTYEFVGVSILVSIGYPPEASLAAIALVHVFVTLPAALLGLLAMWAYHMRVRTIVESAEAVEAGEAAA